jgi:hypothetical protein
MKWLLVVLFLNVQPGGWEVNGFELDSIEECRLIARMVNEKQNAMNEEANRDGRLQIEQAYAWCEKK